MVDVILNDGREFTFDQIFIDKNGTVHCFIVYDEAGGLLTYPYTFNETEVSKILIPGGKLHVQNN